ncbi:MAG TPA: NEW3 domain-containing protein [Rhodothermales bacterium]|nr:NEW3 domain-containing protein [Rhodothermales bacterium]
MYHVPCTGERLRQMLGVALLVLVGIGTMADSALAQSGTFFNQRDDEYRLLGLKRAKEAYETAKAEYERQRALGDKKLISDKEVETARRNFSDAEVNYQQSLLAVVFEQQYVVVSSAIKYQKGGTRKGVRLTLENASGGGAEFQKLVGIDDELFRSLQPDVVNNVYVSLLNDENAIISQPYEKKIDRIRFGEPVRVEFALLQDVDAVTVSMIYGTGTTSSRKIYLQKDASVNIVAIAAEQFSQEVELGGSTDFSLTLELFSGESNTYKLEAVNLPPQINRYFVDPTTDNRLSQFQFTEGVNTRRAALRVFLPDRPTEEVIIDRPRVFYALAIPRERVSEIGSLTETMTEEQIQAINVGYERLELIPRGIGELMVRAQVLTFTIKPNESVSVPIDVVNEGSRRLDNIRVEADPPLNWDDVVDPDVIPQLAISQESKVTITLTPPVGVAPGNYDVRVRTTSLSEDLPIRGEDKTITIKVEQEANIIGTAVIVLLILGLVSGIVVFGIRLSRR